MKSTKSKYQIAIDRYSPMYGMLYKIQRRGWFFWWSFAHSLSRHEAETVLEKLREDEKNPEIGKG